MLSESDEAGSAKRRLCTVLDVAGVKVHQSTQIIITIGGDAGTIENIALNRKEALKLIGLVAKQLRPASRLERLPATTRAWIARRSLDRARMTIKSSEDVQRALLENRRLLPEVVTFLEMELGKMRRLLRPGVKLNANNIIRRFERTVMIVFDAVRR